MTAFSSSGDTFISASPEKPVTVSMLCVWCAYSQQFTFLLSQVSQGRRNLVHLYTPGGLNPHNILDALIYILQSPLALLAVPAPLLLAEGPDTSHTAGEEWPHPGVGDSGWKLEAAAQQATVASRGFMNHTRVKNLLRVQ